MKLLSVVLAATVSLGLSSAAQAEVIAAKKLRLDASHKMLIMLSDERFTCDGNKSGRAARIIVAPDGAMNPSQVYSACYSHDEGQLHIIFWDPTTRDPSDAGTLEMSETSFEKTPSFKGWDFIRTSATPAQ
jgi:hypothetical protein